MSGFHVARLTPGGVVARHYDAPIELDGPWLVVKAPGGGMPLLIAPAHAVIDVEPCALEGCQVGAPDGR